MSSKIGRNDPCPCGSGKKYKKCCSEKDREAESATLKAQNAAALAALPPPEDEESFQADWPLDPALAHLGVRFEDGRRHASEDRWEEALGEWLPLWDKILQRTPGEETVLDELERDLGIDWSVLDLVDELDRGLSEAGRTDPAWHERRRAFCHEVIERFPDSDPLFLLHLRQGGAESLFGLGRADEGEEEFRALAEDPPGEVTTWVTWGDMYGLHRMSDDAPEDLDRAEEIYRLGLERVELGQALLQSRIVQIRRRRMLGDRPPQAYREDPDIAALLSVGDRVPEELWERLVGRGAEVVPALNGLLADALWIDEALSDPKVDHAVAEVAAWGLSHAAYLAARIGDPSSVPVLLEMVDICEDDDWLHSGHPWFPTRFGAASVDAFLGVCLDPNRAFVVRAGFAEGLVWAGGCFPEVRPALAAAFTEAIASGAHDADGFTTWLMFSAARIDDDGVRAAIRAAVDRGAFDEGIFGATEEALAFPRDWYLGEPPGHEDDVTYRSGLPGA